MTDANRPLELVGQMRTTLDEWPIDRVEHAGFGLCVGQPDVLARRRRAHARAVLAAEHALIEIRSCSEQPVVLMKGLEVAQIYPSPTHRPFRDVDALMPAPSPVWHELVSRGFRQNPRRRFDIDHHHLPALVGPDGIVGIELHHRANLPAWATIPVDLILTTAEPSRTGIAGIQRPRDDVHALLMAMHGWKGGFTRLRDLFDALLLASVSEVPVEDTAAELGLTRFWRWTTRFAETALLGRSTALSRRVAQVILPTGHTLAERKRVRLLAPYLVANPVRVTRGHLAEFRLGREARRPSAP